MSNLRLTRKQLGIPTHWIQAPEGHHAIRSVCGRDRGRLVVSTDYDRVTCAHCRRQPRHWKGVLGRHFRVVERRAGGV